MKHFAWLLAGVGLAISTSTAHAQTSTAAERVLRLWAAAAETVSSPGKSARQRILYRHRAVHSGHEINLVLEFLGPIDADELLGRYRFTGVERIGDRLRLTATPRDGVERLFLPQWEVMLDAETYLPVSLAFSGRDERPQSGPIALFTDQQRESIAAANPLLEAPRPGRIRLAAAESRSGNGVAHASANFVANQQAGRNAVIGGPAAIGRSPARMPVLYGRDWKSTATALRDLGYTVRLRRGKSAERPEQIYHVADQSPRPGEPLSRGATVILTLFDKRED